MASCPQWPFSCYGVPEFSSSNILHHDISPEEVMLETRIFRHHGQLDGFMQQLYSNASLRQQERQSLRDSPGSINTISSQDTQVRFNPIMQPEQRQGGFRPAPQQHTFGSASIMPQYSQSNVLPIVSNALQPVTSSKNTISSGLGPLTEQERTAYASGNFQPGRIPERPPF